MVRALEDEDGEEVEVSAGVRMLLVRLRCLLLLSPQSRSSRIVPRVMSCTMRSTLASCCRCCWGGGVSGNSPSGVDQCFAAVDIEVEIELGSVAQECSARPRVDM